MARSNRYADLPLTLLTALLTTGPLLVTAAAARSPQPAAPKPYVAVPAPAAPAAPAAAVPAPGSPAAATPQWPKTLPEAKGAETPAAVWSQAEIDAGRAQCAELLKGLDAVAVPAEPIREGQCGAPAPIELVSIGRNPQVTFSKPPVITCDLAAALGKWLKASVQPAAREHLGAPVVRIDVMSGYSCRNAYGRKKTRLSEHGRANALDIAGFITDKSATVAVLGGWGMTARDIRAKVAAAEAAKREAARREAEANAARMRIAKSKPAPHPDQMPPQTPSLQPAPVETAAGLQPALRGGIDDVPGTLGLDRLRGFTGREPPSLGLTPPSRLGGPKPSERAKAKAHDAPGQDDPSMAQQYFLRRIHTEGCRIFGTILGPEANEAHRNHFHVDAAERARGNFCE